MSNDKKQIYRTFEKAREFIQTIGLNNHQEWRVYCKGELTNKPPKPEDIPVNPDRYYKDSGWVSWGDFLGIETIATRV